MHAQTLVLLMEASVKVILLFRHELLKCCVILVQCIIFEVNNALARTRKL